MTRWLGLIVGVCSGNISDAQSLSKMYVTQGIGWHAKRFFCKWLERHRITEAGQA